MKYPWLIPLLLSIVLLMLYIFSIESMENGPVTNVPVDIQLVVSRYNEDLEWLKEEPFNKYPVIIYNKGTNDDFYKPTLLKEIVPLENVGVCVHSFFYHIINNYNSLSDVTVFLPGSCMDENKKKKTLTTLMLSEEKKDSVFITGVVNDVKKSLYDFNIDRWESSNHKNRELNTSSDLKLSEIRPFGKWFETEFPDININNVNYHGIFSVSKTHIHNRSKNSYERLISYVDKENNTEAAHYFERAFLAVFYPIPENCIYIE